MGDSNFYVWSQDEAGLKQHSIQPANPVQQLDIIHSGEQGAILGLLGGLVLMLGVQLFEPFPSDVGWGVSLLLVGLVAMFGAWVGGFVGVSHDHYKIARFHQAIKEGKHLLVVEVDQRNDDQVQAVMEQYDHATTKEGVDDTYVNPLVGFPFQHLKLFR